MVLPSQPGYQTTSTYNNDVESSPSPTTTTISSTMVPALPDHKILSWPLRRLLQVNFVNICTLLCNAVLMLVYGFDHNGYLSNFTKVNLAITSGIVLLYTAYLLIWSIFLSCCFRSDSKRWYWNGFKLFAVLSAPTAIMAFVGGGMDSQQSLPPEASTIILTFFMGHQAVVSILSCIYSYMVDSDVFERVGLENRGEVNEDGTMKDVTNHHIALQCYLVQIILPPALLILIAIGIVGGLLRMCCGRAGNQQQQREIGSIAFHPAPIYNPYQDQSVPQSIHVY